VERAQIVKIKLVRNYSTYTVGRIVDCEDETAQRLIRDGIAVREPQHDLIIETAAMEPAGERADVTPRKRGRPPRAIPQPQDPDPAGG
jgi:hypothetical protein